MSGASSKSDRKRRAPEPKLTLAQRLLLEQLRRETIPAMAEHRFDLRRRWRIDVVCHRDGVMPDQPFTPGVAIEIDGGAWAGGRHTRGAGFVKDMEKHNALTEHGWRILRFTPQQVEDGSALAVIRRCL